MNGLTNYITERPCLDTITAWYVHVVDAYVRLVVRRGYPLRSSVSFPTFSDSGHHGLVDLPNLLSRARRGRLRVCLAYRVICFRR